MSKMILPAPAGSPANAAKLFTLKKLIIGQFKSPESAIIPSISVTSLGDPNTTGLFGLVIFPRHIVPGSLL
jgi:hypothetical protein